MCFKYWIVFVSLIVWVINGVFVLNLVGKLVYVVLYLFIKLIMLLLNLIGFIFCSNLCLLNNMLIFVGLSILWLLKL